jgi:hypothetical protein
MVTNVNVVGFKSDKGFSSGPGATIFDIIQANEFKVIGGLDITAQTIQGAVVNGDINISPNGTGKLVAGTIKSTTISNQQLVVSNSGTLTGDSNLTWSGSTLAVTGTINTRTVTSTDPVNELTLTSPTAVKVSVGLTVTGNASAANLSATTKVSAPQMEATGVASKIRFYFDNVAAFPSATTWEGSLAYAADTARIYYAGGGSWKLLSIPTDQLTSFNNITITGGSINGTPVGATTPSTGNFTSATVTATPTQATQLTNKRYVDSRFYLALALAG